MIDDGRMDGATIDLLRGAQLPNASLRILQKLGLKPKLTQETIFQQWKAALPTNSN